MDRSSRTSMILLSNVKTHKCRIFEGCGRSLGDPNVLLIQKRILPSLLNSNRVSVKRNLCIGIDSIEIEIHLIPIHRAY